LSSRIELEIAMENRNPPRAGNPPARSARRTFEEADFSDDEAKDETTETPSVENESELRMGGDTGFDRVIEADEAGLGRGLDQAEEARLGVTDEELEEMLRRRLTPNG
jgi:hypothetical protein